MISSVQTQMVLLKCGICWEHEYYSFWKIMLLMTVCFAKDLTRTESLLLQSGLMSIYLFQKDFNVSDLNLICGIVGGSCVKVSFHPFFTHQAQLAGKLPPWRRVRSWALSWSLRCPSSGICSGAVGSDSHTSLPSRLCHLAALLLLCTTGS